MSIKGKFSETLVERMVEPNWSNVKNVTDVITLRANVGRQTQRRKQWWKLIASKLFRCISNETTNVEIIMMIRKYNQTFKAKPNKWTSHAYQRIKYGFLWLYLYVHRYLTWPDNFECLSRVVTYIRVQIKRILHTWQRIV